MNFITVETDDIFAIVGREELQSEIFDNEPYSNIESLPKELVFISISDPSKHFIETNNYFKDELKLKFWDIEEEIGNYAPIHLTQAKEIYDFIIKNKGNRFLINCEAGVSRSAGIGLAIEYIFRDKYLYQKWEHFPSKVLQHWRYCPNMVVFNKIVSFDA